MLTKVNYYLPTYWLVTLATERKNSRDELDIMMKKYLEAKQAHTIAELKGKLHTSDSSHLEKSHGGKSTYSEFTSKNERIDRITRFNIITAC